MTWGHMGTHPALVNTVLSVKIAPKENTACFWGEKHSHFPPNFMQAAPAVGRGEQH